MTATKLSSEEKAALEAMIGFCMGAPLKRAKLGMRMCRRIVKARQTPWEAPAGPAPNKQGRSKRPPRTTVPPWWAPVIDAHMALHGES